jgi:hypothetical protein
MAKRISTAVHGWIDYPLAGILYVAPRILGWWAETSLLLTAIAGGIVIYSLLTRYEGGTIRLIPMRRHLLLDTIAGIALCVGPLLLHESPMVVAVCLVAGLTLLCVAAFTPSYSPEEAQPTKATQNIQPDNFMDRAA